MLRRTSVRLFLLMKIKEKNEKKTFLTAPFAISLFIIFAS